MHSITNIILSAAPERYDSLNTFSKNIFFKYWLLKARDQLVFLNRFNKIPSIKLFYSHYYLESTARILRHLRKFTWSPLFLYIILKHVQSSAFGASQQNADAFHSVGISLKKRASPTEIFFSLYPGCDYWLRMQLASADEFGVRRGIE